MVNSLLANKEAFTEEECSICGKKLTQFGNKKLKDGILCRTCAKISSRWLSDEDYENRSVEDMQKHLQYRKANLEKLNSFKTDKSVEGKFNLLIDRNKKQFLLSKRLDYIKENPDLIPFDDIEEISIIEENYFDDEGKDIFFEIKLNNDEINKIRFRINEFPGIEENSDEYKKANDLAFVYLNGLIDEEDIIVENVLESEDNKNE